MAGSRSHYWDLTCRHCGGWAVGPPAGSHSVKVRVELVAGYRTSQSRYTARLVWAPSCSFRREAGLLLSVGVEWGWGGDGVGGREEAINRNCLAESLDG